MSTNKKIIVFASGGPKGGGSGFENLVITSRDGHPGLGYDVDYEVVAVVSNHERGGVYEHADRLKVPFIYMDDFTAENYQRIVRESGADWVALSGWLQLVVGLDPARTFNIHPGPLPKYGGKGMFGHHVHERIIADWNGALQSAVTMHFVTSEYDQGPVFFALPVMIYSYDSPESLGERVNKAEHRWQPRITDMVVSGKISWDGEDPETLQAPHSSEYAYLIPEFSGP